MLAHYVVSFRLAKLHTTLRCILLIVIMIVMIHSAIVKVSSAPPKRRETPQAHQINNSRPHPPPACDWSCSAAHSKHGHIVPVCANPQAVMIRGLTLIICMSSMSAQIPYTMHMIVGGHVRMRCVFKRLRMLTRAWKLSHKMETQPQHRARVIKQTQSTYCATAQREHANIGT